jgi:biopolymer transport protein ExbD
MKFRKAPTEEPEINLIPFIDVLLVVLIFLMLTTTYSRFTELQVNLPVADADPVKTPPKEIAVAVAQDGRYAINGRLTAGLAVEELVQGLRAAAAGSSDNVVVIRADAATTHQAVVNVMDAARRAGLSQITFATQNSGGKR